MPILIQNTPQTASIFVADNASTDGSVAFLKANYPTVNLVLLPENFGFAGGYNAALSQIEAQNYILLNSDVEVTENWLEPLIEELHKPFTVACQPKIKSFHDKQSFEYAGAAGGFIDYFGYPFCRGRILTNLEIDNGQYNQNKDIFWASGACLAIKASAFHDAGGFDSDFFAHMEEIDLCWRLQIMGYGITAVSNSTVYHVGGGTLPKSNPHKTFLNFRNGLAMIYKNMPAKHFYFRLIGRMFIDGLAALDFVRKGEFKNFSAVFNAHMAFYKMLGTLNTKREEVQKLKKGYQISATQFKGSIVYEFLKNKDITFGTLKWC